jgi:hypothetical protein
MAIWHSEKGASRDALGVVFYHRHYGVINYRVIHSYGVVSESCCKSSSYAVLRFYVFTISRFHIQNVTIWSEGR